jgi:hypothetical protein
VIPPEHMTKKQQAEVKRLILARHNPQCRNCGRSYKYPQFEFRETRITMLCRGCGRFMAEYEPDGRIIPRAPARSWTE